MRLGVRNRRTRARARKGGSDDFLNGKRGQFMGVDSNWM